MATICRADGVVALNFKCACIRLVTALVVTSCLWRTSDPLASCLAG